MAHNIGHSLKCPFPLSRKVFVVNVGSAIRSVRKAGISLGIGEAIDIVAIKATVVSTPAAADGQQMQVGLSHLERDTVNQDGLALQSVATFAQRDDILWHDLFNMRRGSDVGQFEQTLSRITYFNPPLCLVTDFTVEMNVTSHSGSSIDFIIEVYWYKKGVAKSVALQLLKWYTDAKSVFKTGAPAEYDT